MTTKTADIGFELDINTIMPMLISSKAIYKLETESIIDRAIEGISCTPEEAQNSHEHFCSTHALDTEDKLRRWMELYGIDDEQLRLISTRELRIEKFKQHMWGSSLLSYFLRRKDTLDKAVYSIIRVDDFNVAKELYFRIAYDEQSFAEAAREFAQGPEAITGGLAGPDALGKLPLPLAEVLRKSQPGKLLDPIRLGKWFLILRLEELSPAQLDASMKQYLLDELFDNWLKEQLKLVKS